jgi:prepilin-type N-terminal cleavage/methylation domain-containing protein
VSAKGYSLIEVMVAAAIVAVGLTAAAVLASTLMQQQELNAATLRAANLQEQAAKLHRLDLSSSAIRGLLPESCVASGTPPDGGFVLRFFPALTITNAVDTNEIIVERTVCWIVFANPAAAGTYRTNDVSIVRPTTRVKYDQNF